MTVQLNVQTIPLNKLIPSPVNVRKTGTTTGIAELAASIQAHGLLQNLQVRENPNGKFEVVAGGRRLAALRMLAKDKVIAKTEGILCNVLGEQDAGEISLAENIVRLPMHPADQFDAFKALADAGKGPEEIAGRFGTTPAVVRQRLKLASVSPRLIELYRTEEMNLDQLMAFCVADDPAAQEAAWFDQPGFNRSPAAIRRILTAAHVEATDDRVLFVGMEAYVAAGGTVSRDLFQPEHEGYLTDPALLDRLATDRLEREAEAVRAEGWAWVEIMPEIDWNTRRRFERVHAERQPLSEAQIAERDRLNGEYDALVETHGDDPTDEINAQLDALSEGIDSLSEGVPFWRAEDKAGCGALVGIGNDGEPEIERGLIRPGDKVASAPGVEEDEEGSPPSPSGSPAPGVDGLSDRLVEDLTAHRTAALRAMLADSPTVALAAVTHALALAAFYGDRAGTGSCLGVRAHSDDLGRCAEGIADCRAARALDERHADWLRQLPPDEEGLWPWLLTQGTETLTALLAVSAATTLNAVRRKPDRQNRGSGAPHLAHADQLAAALGLDMAQWWQPTAASFFARVPKARILEAVAEGCSTAVAEALSALRKDAIVARAEGKLAGTGWLPALLRPVTAAAAADFEAADKEMAEAA